MPDTMTPSAKLAELLKRLAAIDPKQLDADPDNGVLIGEATELLMPLLAPPEGDGAMQASDRAKVKQFAERHKDQLTKGGQTVATFCESFARAQAKHGITAKEFIGCV
jgi:hypothetical protein